MARSFRRLPTGRVFQSRRSATAHFRFISKAAGPSRQPDRLRGAVLDPSRPKRRITLRKAQEGPQSATCYKPRKWRLKLLQMALQIEIRSATDHGAWKIGTSGHRNCSHKTRPLHHGGTETRRNPKIDELFWISDILGLSRARVSLFQSLSFISPAER